MLPSPAENAKTMKLWTVIVHHKSTKTQQLIFLDLHCSIVSSHCSIVCLIRKSGRNMVENTSYEDEIHRTNGPSNEDSKNIIFFATEAMISGEVSLILSSALNTNALNGTSPNILIDKNLYCMIFNEDTKMLR